MTEARPRSTLADKAAGRNAPQKLYHARCLPGSRHDVHVGISEVPQQTHASTTRGTHGEVQPVGSLSAWQSSLCFDVPQTVDECVQIGLGKPTQHDGKADTCYWIPSQERHQVHVHRSRLFISRLGTNPHHDTAHRHCTRTRLRRNGCLLGPKVITKTFRLGIADIPGGWCFFS